MYVSANEKAVSLNLHRYNAAIVREKVNGSMCDGEEEACEFDPCADGETQQCDEEEDLCEMTFTAEELCADDVADKSSTDSGIAMDKLNGSMCDGEEEACELKFD